MELVLSLRERRQLEAQAQRARERLASLGRETARLESQQQTLLTEMQRLELARERHAAEEIAARAAGRLAEAELAETARRLAVLEAVAAARAPTVQARLRRLSQIGRLDAPRYWLRPDGLVRTARSRRLLAALAARDRALLRDFGRERAALEALRAEGRSRAADAERLARAAQTARADAVQAAARQEALLARVVRERELATRLAGELQDAERQLGALLAAPLGRPTTTGAGAPSAWLPLAPFKGELDWPVTAPAALTARFGRARQSRYGTVLPRNGIELAVPAGTPVQALHEGRVAFADQFAALGRLVIVDHGSGAFSLYGYLGEVAVARGDAVARGTRLGSAGRAPAGDDALYFELRIDGRPVDPLEWLKPVAARRSRRQGPPGP